MYIPNSNKITDNAEALEFMKRFSFGTIVTSKNNIPVATHLPFVIRNDNSMRLISHYAKANEQWKDIEHNKVLVIFSEPHAYISPGNYEHEMNVPTWNYVSVHAYGHGRLITDVDEVIKLIESSIDTYDMNYKVQWNKLPEDYKLKMMKGIVAFEIEVTELQGKKKLSQNKSDKEQENIINYLSNSNHSSESLIADYMRIEKNRKAGNNVNNP